MKETKEAATPTLSLPYARWWFVESVSEGCKTIGLYMFSMAGFHDLYLKGLRHVKFTLTTARGDLQSSTMKDILEQQDVFAGPLTLSTEWGTLDVVGFWNETEKPPVQLARLYLSQAEVD